MKSIEVQLNEALEQIKFLNQQNTDLKAAVTEHRVRAARAERELRFREANLSGSAKDRLHDAFRTSMDNAGLHSAIKVEQRKGAQ